MGFGLDCNSYARVLQEQRQIGGQSPCDIIDILYSQLYTLYLPWYSLPESNIEEELPWLNLAISFKAPIGNRRSTLRLLNVPIP